MNKILPQGFLFGQENDDYTGISVIVCPDGAIGGVDVRGGAPGTHETDLLRPEKAMEKINAVALCGGSAYGLGAIAGVMEALREKNIGFKVGDKIVPIVCGAVIYDLNDKDYHYPTKEFGYNATKKAFLSPSLQSGRVGAGKGATVGKILGIEHACPSGIGISTIKIDNNTVTAIVCVNALGDIYENGKIIAGAKKGNEFLNTEEYLLKGNVPSACMGKNTTIGCILTDAAITKIQANKIASVCHNALAEVIRPVHTDYDGDTLFCMASGKETSCDFLRLEIACQKAVKHAVIDAIKSI